MRWRMRRADTCDARAAPQVISLWSTDSAFALYFSSVLAASSHIAFFWECPPIMHKLEDRPFEFAIVRAHSFAPADPQSFSSFLQCAEGSVTFANLGGDAQLIAPCPQGPLERYGHIAAFVRGASAAEKAALWGLVGTTLTQVLSRRGTSPTWLNTEGSGVPWLHVRLDSVPKYYHTGAYRRRPSASDGQGREL